MNLDAGMSRADREALAELFDSGRVRRTFDEACWGAPEPTLTPRERLYDPDTLRDAYSRLETEGVGEP